jgi:hypothetical protein
MFSAGEQLEPVRFLGASMQMGCLIMVVAAAAAAALAAVFSVLASVLGDDLHTIVTFLEGCKGGYRIVEVESVDEDGGCGRERDSIDRDRDPD